MGPCVTFSGIKLKILDSATLVYICLHFSSDSSTLVYTRLVIRLHLSSGSSTFVCDLSTFVYTRLVTRLCFRIDQ